MQFQLDEEIKQGDWFYFTNGSTKYVQQAPQHWRGSKEFDGFHYKIIATTDSSLKITKEYRPEAFQHVELPSIPQAFINHYIEQYNIGNIITEALVEYESKLTSENGRLSITTDFKERIPKGLGKELNNHSFFGELLLKLNNNEIIITSATKDSYTKEEVETIKKEAFLKGQECESLLKRGFKAEGLRIKFDYFKIK